MESEDTRRLIRLVEAQRDTLDTHSRETRDRWEQHEKDHRAHDKEHSEIGQWQVKTEERLRGGAETLADLKTRTKPLSGTIIATIILAVIGFPVAAALWVRDGLDDKADKGITTKVDAKADKEDVNRMVDKIDSLTATVTHLVDKLKERKHE